LQTNDEIKVLLQKYIFAAEKRCGLREARLRNLLASIVGKAAASIPKTYAEMCKLMEMLLRESLICRSVMQCKSKNALQGGQGFWLSQNLIISSLKDTLNLQ